MSIFSWLRKNSYETEFREVSTGELGQMATEIQARKLAFAVCANMTANALSRAEFRTYENGQEVRSEEYYTWNVQPNPNETGSVFWRKVVCQLMQQGEALLVIRDIAGKQSIWTASDFTLAEKQSPFEINSWRDVTVNDKPIGRNLKDKEVIYLVLNAMYPNTALNAITEAQNIMIRKLQKNLFWRLGQHYKAHINRLPQGDDKVAAKFVDMVNNHLKPFLNADKAVLPEFDGYDYTDMGGEKTASKIPEICRENRKMIDDIFDFTAKAFLIPPVLVSGEVADSKDAFQRWLTVAIDPLAESISNEINRKLYGTELWGKGTYIRVDTSGLQHFDIFANADHIAKLVGSGWSYNDIQRVIGGTEINAEWANEHYFTKNNQGVSELKGGEKNGA